MPIAIAHRPIMRMVMLCALYLAQGMPYGFITVTLAAYLAGQGASTGDIGGLIAIATLPWAFKWAWGPVIDRFSRSLMGRRRPWIVFAQLGMVLTIAALVANPELSDSLSTLRWIVLAHNVFASLQDVAVDALAVDLLPESERGAANGLMYGASYHGVIAGGAGLSTVLGIYGLHAALLVQLLALCGVMTIPLLFREHEQDKMVSLGAREHDSSIPTESILDVLQNLLRAFSRRSPLLGAALSLTVMIGTGAATAIGTVLLMQRLGWSQEDYGQMVGGVPVLFGLFGSVTGGFIADRLGHRRVVAASSLAVGLTWIVFASLESSWASRSFVVAFTCTHELFMGTLSASLFALYMDVSWPRVGATQFTAYMAGLNLSRTLGAKIAGTLTAAFGIGGSYLVLGIIQCAAIMWLIPLDPKQNRRELGE